MNDALAQVDRTHLERLKLAADILLSEHDAITDPLEVELTIFRERVEAADGFAAIEGVLNLLPTYITETIAGELSDDAAGKDQGGP